MNTSRKSLTQFLTTNNSWILITCLISISFMWVMRFNVQFGSMIYMHPDKWLLCIKLIGALIVVFSPALLFSLFRNRIAETASPHLYKGTWFALFLIYPFIAGLTSMVIDIIPVSMTTEMLLLIGLFLLGVEVLTSPLSQIKLKLDRFNWKEKASPEWIVLAVLLYLSLDSAKKLIQVNHAEGGFFMVWLQTLLYLSLFYLFYRINHFYLINKIYKNKGVLYYAFAFVLLMALFYIPFALLTFYLPAYKTMLVYKLGEYWIGSGAPTAFWAMYSGTITRFLILTIPLAILIQWMKQTTKISQLQKEKSDTELNLLKQQFNPHFFFNTLNNVYAMSLTKDEKTSESILQLSDLMRYVIYKGKEETVTLQEEVDYIEDFLQLHKMRFHQNLDLKFEINIENPKLQITPLLFIILVENAFKHGIEGAEHDAYLHITLNESNSEVRFSCLNSIEEEPKPAHSGLGLSNLKRRLALIYPDSHELIIEKRKYEFYTHLRIDL